MCRVPKGRLSQQQGAWGGRGCRRDRCRKRERGPGLGGLRQAEKLELCSRDDGRPWMVLEPRAAHRHPLGRPGGFDIFASALGAPGRPPAGGRHLRSVGSQRQSPAAAELWARCISCAGKSGSVLFLVRTGVNSRA